MEKLAGTTFPAVKNGALVMCEGDRFTLRLRLRLFSLGEEITDLTGYTLTARFFDRGGGNVCTFTEQGDESCVFPLVFGSSSANVFPRGSYSFDVHADCPDGTRVTLANDVPMRVL